MRPALQKAAGKGVSAVNKVTLVAAEAQKMTLCSALLKEVGTRPMCLVVMGLGFRRQPPLLFCVCVCIESVDSPPGSHQAPICVGHRLAVHTTASKA